MLGRRSTLLTAFPALRADFQAKQNVWKAFNKHGRSLLSPVSVETNVPQGHHPDSVPPVSDTAELPPHLGCSCAGPHHRQPLRLPILKWSRLL